MCHDHFAVCPHCLIIFWPFRSSCPFTKGNIYNPSVWPLHWDVFRCELVRHCLVAQWFCGCKFWRHLLTFNSLSVVGRCVIKDSSSTFQATHFAWIHCHIDCSIHLRLDEIVPPVLSSLFLLIPSPLVATQADRCLFLSTFYICS